MLRAKVAAAAPEKSGASGATVRVNTEKLDSLMDVVGELVIVQSQIMESARSIAVAGSPLHRNVAQLSRITKELQHTSMALRMIPIKQTFQKMERLARDLARSCVKKVQFATAGEDTELDRTVVEEIGDPLVHMVRNALDHGLETTAQRIAAGKSETGTVHLCAYHQGSNIVIELKDDGHGINPEKIFKKAVEKGIISRETLETANRRIARFADRYAHAPLVKPDLSVLLFERIGWELADYERWNAELVAGQVGFVTPSRHLGRACARFAIINPQTTAADLALLIDSMA